MASPKSVWVIEHKSGGIWAPATTISLRLAAYSTRAEARCDLYNGQCGFSPKSMQRIRRYVRGEGGSDGR